MSGVWMEIVHCTDAVRLLGFATLKLTGNTHPYDMHLTEGPNFRRGCPIQQACEPSPWRWQRALTSWNSAISAMRWNFASSSLSGASIRQPGGSRTRDRFLQPMRLPLHLTFCIKSGARFLWRPATELEKTAVPGWATTMCRVT